MTTAVLGCLAACVLFAVTAPAVGRRLPPAAAVRLLAAGSVVAAGCAVFVVAVVAFIWIGQFGEVAEWGHWSPSRLQATSPLPEPVGVLASALLLPAVAVAVAAAVRRVRALIGVHLACGRLARPGEIGVIDSAVPDAFTTPELVGRIVVTTGLLHVVTTEQRGALLAHERSHLIHRHTWWRIAADLAAAVNPLLRPAAATVADVAERWADEDAAAAMGDRRLVATAVAAAARARRHTPGYRQAPGMAAVGGRVPQRVRALLAPPPRPHPILLGLLAAVLVCGVGAAAVVERRGEDLFERAALTHHDVARVHAAPDTRWHAPRASDAWLVGGPEHHSAAASTRPRS